MVRKRMIFGMLLLSTMCLGAFASQSMRFNDNWKFKEGDAAGAQAASFSDGSWESVCLPHTAKIETKIGTMDYYLGICWFRKTFTQDASWSGKKVFIEFEAAMQTATVYLNGTSLTTHQGGYKPFVLDITDKLVSGSNTIAVKLDNNYNAAFGPGVPLDGIDFDYFGGLYRNVNLIVTDKLHITNTIFETTAGVGGVFAYSSVTSGTATVTVKTHVRNENTAAKTCGLKTVIVDQNGVVAATDSTSKSLNAGDANNFSQAITVSSPKLWSPDAPNLYTVRSYVSDGSKVVDTMYTTIGIRTIKFDRTGFQINGKRLIFRGANRHQDYAYIGNTVPNSGQYREALRLKEYGFNFVRCSHYPQAKAFVDACDKLGVMVMPAIPGWHSPEMTANSLLDIRNMVRYYRNNPSVICWETVHNESGDKSTLTAPGKTAATEEFGGNQIYTAGENTASGVDVFAPTTQSSGRTKGASESRPCLLSEYGDWNFGGKTSSSRVARSDGEAKMLKQASNHYLSLDTNRSLSWLCGDALWSGFDYQTTYASLPHLLSGVFDIFRIPKFSAYFYQSQRDPNVIMPGVSSGPMVYIASWATSSSSKSVTVFSNCEQVSLSANGGAAVTQSPDKYAHLEHAPFTFNVSSMGTLKAIGLIGGKEAATYTVAAPGSPAKITVVIDTATLQLQADGSDIAIAYATIRDANGNYVPTASDKVTFSVSGSGKIVGESSMNAVAGIASAFVQAQTTTGLITVKATSGSLTEGSATVQSVAPGTPVFVSQKKMNVVSLKNENSIHLQDGMLFVSAPQLSKSDLKNTSFTLYNVLGGKVRDWNLSKNSMSVSMKTLTHGVYFGRIRHASENLFVQKVIW